MKNSDPVGKCCYNRIVNRNFCNNKFLKQPGHKWHDWWVKMG
jgi:hypothetical protein